MFVSFSFGLKRIAFNCYKLYLSLIDQSHKLTLFFGFKVEFPNNLFISRFIFSEVEQTFIVSVCVGHSRDRSIGFLSPIDMWPNTMFVKISSLSAWVSSTSKICRPSSIFPDNWSDRMWRMEPHLRVKRQVSVSKRTFHLSLTKCPIISPLTHHSFLAGRVLAFYLKYREIVNLIEPLYDGFDPDFSISSHVEIVVRNLSFRKELHIRGSLSEVSVERVVYFHIGSRVVDQSCLWIGAIESHEAKIIIIRKNHIFELIRVGIGTFVHITVFLARDNRKEHAEDGKEADLGPHLW